MSQKELEVEFKKLADEFKELKSLTEKLFKKYENLENKYERCLKVRANPGFKCRVCEQECENIHDLQKHKEEEHNTLTEFMCGECERSFKSEKKNWKFMKSPMKCLNVMNVIKCLSMKTYWKDIRMLYTLILTT